MREAGTGISVETGADIEAGAGTGTSTEAGAGMTLVKSSYSADDCKLLLKDLTSVMEPKSSEEREALIQSGTHYSELLPEEKAPTERYMQIYNKAVDYTSEDIAIWVNTLCKMVFNRVNKGRPILVSLARAGLPLGVLIKRCLKIVYGTDCNHYGISIIRDKGIDVNAMDYIYREEVEKLGGQVENIVFIDGWVGKGVIKIQLDDAVKQLQGLDKKWDKLRSDLFVISDPANVTEYCATRQDVLLPFACLNSTVSGLISRTIANRYIDSDNGDFHGAVYFNQFESIDQTNKYLSTIDLGKWKSVANMSTMAFGTMSGMEVVVKICTEYGIDDYKKVKPGIGETTRVLLRRIPYKVLISKRVPEHDRDIQHILELCHEKNVETERFDLGDYKVCGIIKDLHADA